MAKLPAPTHPPHTEPCLPYILKRILLMLPTLLGVLLLTFAVVQFVPGGPVEQYLAEAKAERRAEGWQHGYWGAQAWDPQRLEQIKALYDCLTSRPKNALCRCWASSRALIWGRSFFQNKDVGNW